MMKKANTVLNTRGRYHAVSGIPNGDTSGAASAIDCGSEEEGLPFHWQKYEPGENGLGFLVSFVLPYTLKDFGHYDSANADILSGLNQRFDGSCLCGFEAIQEIYPDRGVDENHAKVRPFRISDRLPSHCTLPLS